MASFSKNDNICRLSRPDGWEKESNSCVMRTLYGLNILLFPLLFQLIDRQPVSGVSVINSASDLILSSWVPQMTQMNQIGDQMVLLVLGHGCHFLFDLFQRHGTNVTLRANEIKIGVRQQPRFPILYSAKNGRSTLRATRMARLRPSRCLPNVSSSTSMQTGPS